MTQPGLMRVFSLDFQDYDSCSYPLILEPETTVRDGATAITCSHDRGPHKGRQSQEMDRYQVLILSLEPNPAMPEASSTMDFSAITFLFIF